MDPVLRLMHVRGVVRQAIKLVKGVNIKTSSDRLTLEVFSVIGWFKVAKGGGGGALEGQAAQRVSQPEGCHRGGRCGAHSRILLHISLAGIGPMLCTLVSHVPQVSGLSGAARVSAATRALHLDLSASI